MISVFCDGAVRPVNPGPGGYGLVAIRDGLVVGEDSGYLGDQVSNNQAEYAALLAGLVMLRCFSGEEVVIYSDSLLVVNQVNGFWTVRDATLGRLHQAARRLLTELSASHGVRLAHVKGHAGHPGNERADFLAGQAVTERRDASKVVLALFEGGESALSGFEKLLRYAMDAYERRGKTVFNPAMQAPSSLRASMLRSQSPGASTLAYFPRLAVMDGSQLTMVVIATSYYVPPVGPAVRTMEIQSLDTARRVCAFLQVPGVLVHQPHGRGEWKSARDLNWGPDAAPVSPVVAQLETVVVTDINRAGPWAPAARLEADWQPFS